MSHPSHQSRLPKHRLSRFLSLHLTLWLGLLIPGVMVVLSSALAGARSESLRRAPGAVQKKSTKSMAGVLNEDGSPKPVTAKSFDLSAATRKEIEAKLFLNPQASPVGTTQAAASSAAIKRTPNNGSGPTEPGGKQEEKASSDEQTAQAHGEEDKVRRKPKEERLTRAHPFNGDLRDLPYRKPVKRERPKRVEPEANPTLYPGASATTSTTKPAAPNTPNALVQSEPPTNALAPATIANFAGLDFADFGAGHPPDTNGDVGPTYYIQVINASIGIFRKSDGVRVAAFTFNTFMSQGNFGNPCDTDNRGDPVVLYDSFEDRWIITDLAFTRDGSNNVVNPPGSFQCIAASKTGDPVSGGWNFYSINTTGGLGDYPKFGIWPDGLYMSANMYNYSSGGAFQNPRAYAINKAQMYAGAPTVQSVSFNAPAVDFSILPSNARLQTGTPPTGSPNYFVSSWRFLDGLIVYKFHVDWNRLSASTFTGPDFSQAATSWPNANVANAPSQGGNALDVLQIRAMMQNQYSFIGGAESLWTTHTVRRGNTTGFAAPRWYQVNVTGGSVAANLPQAATWDPDASNVIHRFLPSLAVDRMGDMAIGYSASSSTTKPAIKYAGRLATDPVNTFSQTEQVLIQGTGTQTGNCSGVPCIRWGDYSAMSLDPDGCTFWYTNEYYDTDGLNYLTRIGSFSFPQCTAVGSGGTLSGTVTDSATSNPISGALVSLGSRTTTTDAVGAYIFLDLPAGTYPSITASFAGYGSSAATSIVVADAATTTQDFSLTVAPTSACLVDTSQADFQTGALTNAELTTSPGDVKLANAAAEGADQVSSPAALSITGNLTATAWTGQTFRAGISGNLTKISVGLGLASGSSGTITVEIRNLSGTNPGATVLATGTLGPVTNVGTASLYTTTFATPAAVVSGTSYSIVIRTSVGNTVFGVRGSTAGGSTLANGQVFTTTNSGAVWTPVAADLYFTTFVTPPLVYYASGNLVSGVKDADPAAGIVSYWKTLSWTATIPANTNIQFQAAASNSINGPFNFVGPDGTAATFFASGASLTQFNGFRYLKYEALLSTTDSSNATPTLNDVTICFTDTAPTITAAAPLSSQQGSAAINQQIAAVSDANQTADTLNVTATPLTGTGVAINNISIDAAGRVTADVAADCTATNSTFTLAVTDSESATVYATLIVNATASATPTITPGGPTIFCDSGSVTLTSSAGSGNQWYLNGNPIGGATAQQYTATASGDYTVTANSCTGNPSVATTVTVNPIPPTPTITPGGPTTFCEGGSVALTSSSASGNQWYLNGNPIGGATSQFYSATASGNYSVTVTAGGCTSAPSASATVTVNPIPATPTIAPGGQAILCNGGSVTLTSSGASGNQWYLNGNPIGGATAQQYIATAPGSYTVVLTENGCAGAPSTPTTVAANTAPVLAYQNQTVTFNAPLTINPATGPSDDVSMSSIAVLSVGAYTGSISVNNTTGAVSISNAAPAGTHTITIRAKDNCGANTDVSFTLTVSKANQTITVNTHAPSNATYNMSFTVAATADSSLPVTYSSAGVCTNTGATFTMTSGTGSCMVKYDQAGDTSYNAATQVIESVTAQKTTATVTLSDLSHTYDGSAKAATAVTSPAGKPVNIAYSQGGSAVASPTDAGSYDVSAAINDADYQGSATGTLLINKATPIITWNNPADIIYGKALSDTQLNATASVAGTFIYTPASGTILNAGSNQTLSVTFTPTDTTNYDIAPKSVSINVLKADQTITFDALSTKTFGDSDFDVSATAGSSLGLIFTATGQCAGTGPTVHITGAGSCTITASQGGNSNYNAAPPIDRSFTISKASATITLFNLSRTYDGTPKTATVVTNPSGLTVVFAYSQDGQPVSSPTNAGNYDVTATVNEVNYQGSTTGILVIDKAAPVITWNNPASVIYGTPLGSIQLNAAADTPGIFQYNPPAGAVLSVGTHQLSVTFTPADAVNYTTASKSVLLTVEPVTAPALNFDNATYAVNEGDGHAAVTVNRTGNGVGAATVNYTTSDNAALTDCNVTGGIASSRCDYATSVGTLRFAAGETSKTIYIPLVDDSYAEGAENFSITMSNAVGENLGEVSTAAITIQDNETVTGANPIDDVPFFVRQHYIDFLGREPEAEGFAGWLNILSNCGTTFAQPCDRIEVSSDFFRSEEFQLRGYFIYRFYSLLGRIPHYAEFMPDMANVSGFLSSQQLEANKTAFVEEFMARQEFQTRYGSLTDPTAYVDALLQTVGLPNHPSRGTWITALTNGTLTRAQVLRALIESSELYQKLFNEAFVIMQYVGYLRRDADSLYLQWVQMLNQTGDYRMMINGFLNSVEYRRRFGP